MDSLSDVLGQLVRDVNACATLESLATGKGLPKPAKPRVRRRGKGAGTGSAPVAPSARGGAAKAAVPFDTHERVTKVVQACREARKRHLADAVDEDLSDERLSKLARFTDDAALEPFASFLHFVPRLVNIVTLAEAVPMPGSGLTPGQPLDLAKIAAKCNGAYFAPKRFAAVRRNPFQTHCYSCWYAEHQVCFPHAWQVQLAYTNPRCRILVFRESMHTRTPTHVTAAAS